MARQTRTPSKFKTKAKRSPRPPSATTAGRNALMLEEMRAQNRATIEAVLGNREATKRELKEQREESAAEFAFLKFEIKEILSRLADHDRMFKSQSEVLAQHGAILVQMNAKLDEHGNKLDEHSKKLDEHSKKLDEHSKKLDEHSARFDEQGAQLADQSARLERIEAKLDRKAEAADLAALAERVDRLEKVAAS